MEIARYLPTLSTLRAYSLRRDSSSKTSCDPSPDLIPGMLFLNYSVISVFCGTRSFDVCKIARRRGLPATVTLSFKKSTPFIAPCIPRVTQLLLRSPLPPPQIVTVCTLGSIKYIHYAQTHNPTTSTLLQTPQSRTRELLHLPTNLPPSLIYLIFQYKCPCRHVIFVPPPFCDATRQILPFMSYRTTHHRSSL